MRPAGKGPLESLYFNYPIFPARRVAELDAAVEHTVNALLECGPEALRAQKALLRQWEELPLTESVNLSVGVFGKSFLTGEPQRLMQGFLDRKK